MESLKTRTDTWVATHRRIGLAALIFVLLALRLGYFLELNDSPCIWAQRWDQTDMSYFDHWALQIDRGDYLSRYVSVPMHDWQKGIASRYLATHPAESASLARQVGPHGDVAKTLWEHWTGHPAFYQEPLYPYLIALTYAVFGPDPRWVFAWQMLVGVASVLLIHAIARRCFGETVGALAAILAALCGPLICYELILLRDCLVTFTGLLIVFLVLQARDRETWPWWLALGVAFGWALLLKSSLILLEAPALAILVLLYRRRRHILTVSVSIIIGAMALCLAPLVIRNELVGAPPLALAGGGVVTFVAMNAGDYPPFGAGFLVSDYTPEIMGRSDGRLWPAVVATLKTHSGPGSVLRMLWARFGAIWNWLEMPNNTNFYYYRLHSAVLQWLPVTFWIISPLSLVGLALMIPTLRASWPLYLLIAANLAVLLAFFMISRLRLPMFAGLIPFAAAALLQIARWAYSRRYLTALAAVAAAFLLGLWTSRYYAPRSMWIRLSDYAVPYVIYYSPQIQAAEKQRDFARAADLIRSSLQSEPAVSAAWPPRAPADDSEAQLDLFYSRIHHFLALDMQRSGNEAAGQDEDIHAAQLKQLADAYEQSHNTTVDGQITRP